MTGAEHPEQFSQLFSNLCAGLFDYFLSIRFIGMTVLDFMCPRCEYFFYNGADVDLSYAYSSDFVNHLGSQT